MNPPPGDKEPPAISAGKQSPQPAEAQAARVINANSVKGAAKVEAQPNTGVFSLFVEEINNSVPNEDQDSIDALWSTFQGGVKYNVMSNAGVCFAWGGGSSVP